MPCNEANNAFIIFRQSDIRPVHHRTSPLESALAHCASGAKGLIFIDYYLMILA